MSDLLSEQLDVPIHAHSNLHSEVGNGVVINVVHPEYLLAEFLPEAELRLLQITVHVVAKKLGPAYVLHMGRDAYATGTVTGV